MTREHAKQMLPILTAWANGEEIQGQYNNGKWIDVTDNPTFNTECNYRIKPKPREWTLCISTEKNSHHGAGVIQVHEKKVNGSSEWESIRVREIID